MDSSVTNVIVDCNASRLLPQHRADLEKSGLKDEIIDAAGLYSESVANRVRELLGGYLSLNTTRAMEPCLVFPFLDAEGKPMTWQPSDTNGNACPRRFVRLKPDNPRRRDGKPIKYESPFKSGNRIFIPPGVGSTLADAVKELVIVEGEKKALAGAQAGFATIAISGVWNWQVKRPKDALTGRGTGPRRLIDDLERINWSVRRVRIIFDSDLKDKPGVEWALVFRRGARRARGRCQCRGFAFDLRRREVWSRRLPARQRCGRIEGRDRGRAAATRPDAKDRRSPASRVIGRR